MSVYAFKCIDLFCKKDIKNKLYFKNKKIKIYQKISKSNSKKVIFY